MNKTTGSMGPMPSWRTVCLACGLALVWQARAGDLTADKMTVDDTLYLGGTNATWNITNSVMAQLHLDDNTNTTTVVDSSGRGHIGTLYGGGNTADHHIDGKVGTGAFTFDGVNDHVQMANSSDFQPGTNSFSMSIWMKPHKWDYAYAGFIIDKLCNNDGNYPQFALFLVSDGSLCFATYYQSASVIYSSPGSTPNNVWTHVVCVRNCDGTMQIYINGSVDKQETLPVRYVSNTMPLSLGYEYRWGGGNYFDGDLDDFCFFNKALTAAEVRGLYNEGSGTPQMTGVQYGIVRGEVVFEGNTNRIKGKLRCDQGVTYSPALGDLSMGSYTNAP